MRPRDVDQLIESLDFPTTTDAIIRDHGTRTLRLQDGSETVAQVIGRCGPQIYDRPDDVRLSLYASVCCDAVGRRWYTDRDPPLIGSDGPDPVSF